ncbi:MAG: helix-turn-helix transcriptional regulator [Deltaproteobacteria bacterium]|nr:helix-turn-helix transcriptional regulator [Deltaproteobacteria bacterium]
MAIHWRLKTYLATQHGIYRATQLQKLIAKKTGILISLQNLCNYLKEKPKAIKFKTLEILCTALECEFKEFLEVIPSQNIKDQKNQQEVKKLSWKNCPLSKRGIKNFPDPINYEG